MKTAFRTLTTISAMSIVLLLGNCSKDPDPVPDDVIIGKWNVTSVDVTITIGSQSLEDYFISMGQAPADAQDAAEQTKASYEAFDGGSFEFKNGGTYSSLFAGDDPRTGTWELTSDRKKLTMDKGTANEYVFTITALTSTNLNMTYDYLQGTLSAFYEITLTK